MHFWFHDQTIFDKYAKNRFIIGKNYKYFWHLIILYWEKLDLPYDPSMSLWWCSMTEYNDRLKIPETSIFDELATRRVYLNSTSEVNS